jgi:hypothetical protein
MLNFHCDSWQRWRCRGAEGASAWVRCVDGRVNTTGDGAAPNQLETFADTSEGGMRGRHRLKAALKAASALMPPLSASQKAAAPNAAVPYKEVFEGGQACRNHRPTNAVTPYAF